MNFNDQLKNSVGKAGAIVAEISSTALMFLYDHWGALCLPIAITIGLLGLTPLKGRGDESTAEWIAIWTRKMSLYFAALLVLIPITLTVILQTAERKNILAGLVTLAIKILLQTLLLVPVVAATFGLRLWCLRKVAPKVSALMKKITVKQTNEELSDIRAEGETIKAKNFNPSDYYKWGFIFFGLDENGKPEYMELDDFLQKHLQVVGSTGFGKGVVTGCIIDQLIWQKITVLYFAAKLERWMPHIMYQGSQKHSRPFHYVSLFDEDPGEWGPFLGGDIKDARSRFELAFGIGQDTGDNSAIHKARERRMAMQVFNQNRDVDALFKGCEVLKEDSRITTELDVWRTYRTLCVENGGFSVRDTIINGGVVYIRGSLSDKIMKTCFNLMIEEISQELVSLAGVKKPRVYIHCDEASAYVSQTIPQTVATVRELGGVVGLSYQSTEDLKNLENQNINAGYVYNGINVNCQMKLFYGGYDDNSSDFISKLAGTVVREVATGAQVESNAAAAETWTQKSNVERKEVPLFHPNMIKLLPERVCIFLRPKAIAKLCFTDFVRVEDLKALPNYLATLSRPTFVAIAPIPIAAPHKPNAASSLPNSSKVTAPSNASATSTGSAPAPNTLGQATTSIAPPPSPFSTLALPPAPAPVKTKAPAKAKSSKKKAGATAATPPNAAIAIEPWVPDYYDIPPPTDDDMPPPVDQEMLAFESLEP